MTQKGAAVSAKPKKPDKAVVAAAKPAKVKPANFVDNFRAGTIARQTVELIIAGKKSNNEILAEVKKTHKDAETTAACIAWYKSKCRKAGAIK